tara:strand:- start:257 stop:460 length:204 start_codon:yes stop_codon:yes gene_type:complete
VIFRRRVSMASAWGPAACLLILRKPSVDCLHRLLPLEHAFACIGLAAAGKAEVLAPPGVSGLVILDL